MGFITDGFHRQKVLGKTSVFDDTQFILKAIHILRVCDLLLFHARRSVLGQSLDGCLALGHHKLGKAYFASWQKIFAAIANLPLEILSVGSTGTRNLLDLTVAHGARFLLASTSEVYGDPLVHPQDESYFGNVDPVGPRSCYDEAKRFSEALASAYERVHGIEVRIARIFNTYGERMRADDGRVLTNFVIQALDGRPITLYGDGSRTRSFCYVTDEVAGLLDGHIVGPVNVGSSEEVTIREVAELVRKLTGSTSSIVEVPLPAEREGDPQRRRPDITRIEDGLGWRPTTSLDVGLARMIESMRSSD